MKQEERPAGFPRRACRAGAAPQKHSTGAKPILIDIEGEEDQKHRIDAAREAAKFLHVCLGEKRFKEFMKLIKEADMLEFERQLKKNVRRKQTTSEQQLEAMERQPTYGMFS